MVIITKVDVLAIGAHPDDVEAGAGGLVALITKLGHSVKIVDLTAGEMSSNGTTSIRRQEALKACDCLGAKDRVCLNIPDRNINIEEKNIMQLVKVIRESSPKLILCPYWEDRHPDHLRAAQLVHEASFHAGLSKVLTDFPPCRPSQIWYYFLSWSVEPRFIVDISEVYEQKMQALQSHQSQFSGSAGSNNTFLNTGLGSFLNLIQARDRYFGALISSKYGEGFITRGPLAIGNPLGLLEVAR